MVEDHGVMRLRETAAFWLIGTATLTACGGKAPPPTSKTAAPPTLFTVEAATVDAPLSLPSQLYSEQDTWVYARSAGVVESLLVDIGSTVTAGQLLATLESTDQTLALQRAEITFAATNRAMERAHELAKSRTITLAEVEQSETDFHQAEIARDQARRAMALTRVTAPFGGVVAARSSVRTGRLVASGDSLMRVTALWPLRAAVHVPEAQAAGLAVGSAASIVGLGGSARASVIRAAPSVDAASGTRELILELTGTPSLRPGTSVTVHVGGERRQVIAIPAAALSDSGYVVVWQDGRTSLRPVTLGPKLPDGRVEVTSGLTAGERVVPAHS